jgi:hypothetical protein
MQLSETPQLGFTGVVNANLLIHGRQIVSEVLSFHTASKPPTGRESGWKPVFCTTGRAPFGRAKAAPRKLNNHRLKAGGLK